MRKVKVVLVDGALVEEGEWQSGISCGLLVICHGQMFLNIACICASLPF